MMNPGAASKSLQTPVHRHLVDAQFTTLGKNRFAYRLSLPFVRFGQMDTHHLGRKFPLRHINLPVPPARPPRLA